MNLGPAHPTIDLHSRLRAEARSLPATISIIGEPAIVALARALAQDHLPHLTIDPHGPAVTAMCMEEYGERAITAFIEGGPLPGSTILSSIPESVLVHEADVRGIALPPRPRSAARDILERITREQPQTPFSLSRSARRLRELLDG